MVKIEVDKVIKESRLKIGQTIREIREEKGISQDDLAILMQVNRSTISKIEGGKFNLSIDYLAKFSLYLNFKIELN